MKLTIATRESRLALWQAEHVKALLTQQGHEVTLLGNADAALYRAKADARGSIRFFEPDMDHRLRERRGVAHLAEPRPHRLVVGLVVAAQERLRDTRPHEGEMIEVALHEDDAVGAADRLGNAAQLHTLMMAGYEGFASFEPFAEEIAAATNIEQRLTASMAYLSQAVAVERMRGAQPA